jgi:hypothetical protein
LTSSTWIRHGVQKARRPMKEFAGENLLKDFRFVHLILGGAALEALR